jgi:HSP20 family protein
MMLQRWDPFREMISLREAVDRLFRESFVRPGNWLAGAETPTVALDVHESDNEYVVKASLPGVKPEDTEILAQGNTLTIRGQSKADEEKQESGYLLRERHYGAFQRSLTLPVPVNADQAEARYENGVLVLTLPKAEQAKPKQITVSGQAQLSQSAHQEQPAQPAEGESAHGQGQVRTEAAVAS